MSQLNGRGRAAENIIIAIMDAFFKKKPTAKEQLRQQDRELRKVNRDVTRDRSQLEREEKKLELEIKKAAKADNKAAVTVLAKQLVQLRKQKQRTYVASSQITAVGYQAKAMGANVRMAEAMKDTTKTMGAMNKAVDPVKVAKTMNEFSMANDKMAMTEETSKYIKYYRVSQSSWTTPSLLNTRFLKMCWQYK